MLDRSIAPPFNRNFAFKLIDPEYTELSNSLQIFFVKGGDQNVIKVDLIFPAGRWQEEVWGASYFTTHLLTKGTATKSSFEIASAFDQLGAHLDVTAGLDFVTLSLYSLTRNFSQALELLVDLILSSTLPEKEIGQLKSIYIQNLHVNQEKTSFLASKLFKKVLFGEGHPYGKELGEIEIAKILRNDLTRFYQEYFRQFTVIVSGKIDPSSQKVIVDLFSKVIVKKTSEKIHRSQPSAILQHHTEKSNSVQTSLRMGKMIIDRAHPDYAQLVFLNHILGGYFGSRLMKNIREEKGLTYGIYSSVQTLKHNGYLTIATDVNKENKSLAFAEIRKELLRLCEEKINEDELDTARYHFIGSFQTELSTSFSHADKIRSIILFDLGMDHYNRMLQQISETSSAELLAIAGKYLVPESFYEVSAG